MKTQFASGAFLVSLVALLSAPAGTAYAGTLDSAVSDGGVEAPTEAALTGTHSLQQTGSVIFRARFQDRRGEDPEGASVVVDGWLYNLLLVSGEPSDGIYELTLPKSDGCREFFFHFIDGAGIPRRYPSSGSLLTQGEGGCPAGFLEDSIAAGESQKLGFFVLPESPSEMVSLTRAHFSLRGPAKVQLTVHDISGKRIRDLLCEEMSGGMHDVAWDGRDLNGAEVTAGLYFYRLRLRKVDEPVAVIVPEAIAE